jgi:hypothetical protein
MMGPPSLLLPGLVIGKGVKGAELIKNRKGNLWVKVKT